MVQRGMVILLGGAYRRYILALGFALLVVVAILAGWIPRMVVACGHVLALYFAAWLLQFFFTPWVDRLARRGVPRVLAVSFVYTVLGVGLVVFLYATIPGLVSQGQNLGAKLANPHTYIGVSHATQALESIAEKRFHVPHSQIQQFTKNYSFKLTSGALIAGKQLQTMINSRLTPTDIGNGATAILSFLNALNTFFLNALIVLILAFYMMLDGHKLVRQALAYFPPAADEVMESVHQIINRKFGGYIRSQVILALSYGLLTYLISVGFALRYSILVAAVAAIAMLVPFIGAFAAIVPPLIAFVLVHVTDPTFPIVGFVVLFVFLAVAQHVVLNLLAPRVMGNALNMHPLLVMLGLLLGAELSGLWGAIFGVPVLGVLLDVADLAYRRVASPRHVHLRPLRPRHKGVARAVAPQHRQNVE
jgi:predicted PurR-regulated permease PerM